MCTLRFLRVFVCLETPAPKCGVCRSAGGKEGTGLMACATSCEVAAR